MKKFYILLIALLAENSALPQTTQPCSSCLPDGFTFTTQEQIDNFQTDNPGCTEIEGDVEINGSDITNLNGLNVLTAFWGNLSVINNDALASLTGLDNVTSIGGALYMNGNPALTSLTGLDNVTSFEGTLYISFNDALTSLTGLENLTSIGEGLFIWRNPALTGLSGLDNVTAIGGSLRINENDSLTSLAGLDNLTSIAGGYFVIAGNASLTSLTGLDNLTSTSGHLLINFNPALTSLTGLENLTSIGGDIEIRYNAALTSLMGLENMDASSINNIWIKHNNSLSNCEILSICDYLASPNGIVEIYNNAPGCNSQEEVLEACEFISVEDLTPESSFLIYSTSASSQITIETSTVPPKNTYLTLYNLNGQQLIEQQITEPTTMIDVGALPGGIYFVRLTWEKGIQVGKFVRE